MYHLKDATFQNTHFNAAYVPEYGNFFLGLPVISGINAHVSSKLSYNELFTPSGDSTIIDLTKAIENLTRQNGLYGHFNINLLHLGLRLPNNAVVSFFANERIEIDFLFPKEPMQLLWEGNATILENEVKIGRFALSANHFREIGLGYAYAVPDFGTRFGIRAKYLQGMFNASMPGSLKANFLTENENHQINVDLKDAMIRTSSIQIATGDEGDIGSHLIGNGNTGFALDLGAEYKYNRYYTFALGINDVGFINWKEDIRNYHIDDTTFRYTGSQLKGAYDLQDSLDMFSEIFEYEDDNTEPYTAWLPTRIFGSMIWNGYPGIDVITTISSRIIQGQPRFSFGVGGRYTTGSGFTASANLTKLDQQFFNIGVGLAAKVSVLQIYLASDHLVGYSAPDLDAFDIRLGVNFIFSKRQKSANSGPGGGRSSGGRGPGGRDAKRAKGPKYGYFLGKEVKVKGQEGIYDVIKEQKKRPPGGGSSPDPEFDKKVEEQPTSEKPKFENTQPNIQPSKKPKFERKKTVGGVSPKPKFRKKATVGGSSPKPKFDKKKKASNSSSKKPKFKKRKRRKN